MRQGPGGGYGEWQGVNGTNERRQRVRWRTEGLPYINGLEAFSAYSATTAMLLFAGVEDKSALRGYAGIYVCLRIPVAYTCVYLSPLNGFIRTAVFSMGLFYIWSMLVTASTLYDMNEASTTSMLVDS
jgi:hypothetical protein